jgi:hypothetical protein
LPSYNHPRNSVLVLSTKQLATTGNQVDSEMKQ